MNKPSGMLKGGFELTYDEDIAWLAIDVPGESVNILKSSFIEALSAVFEKLRVNPPASGLVIYSKKPDNFIAGADIAMFDQFESPQDARQLVQKGQDIFNQLAELPFPVIAAIHGACLGGGLELALACDLRVCSDDPKTCLGLPELQLGILPGLGGTQRLPRLIGLIPALDMMLTGKKIRPQKASKLRLVDACVHQDGLLEIARKMVRVHQAFAFRKKSLVQQLSEFRLVRHLIIRQARAKAQKKARHHYPAVDAVLDVIQRGLDEGTEAGLLHEAQWFGQLVFSPQSCALRSVFFSTSRLKRELEPEKIPSGNLRVAILGGGLMGAGIGCVTVDKARQQLRVKDISHQGVLHAFRYIDRVLRKKQRRKVMSQAERRATMARLSGGIDFSGFAQADIVIEAVFEDLALKQEMVQQTDAHTNPSTVFATNTSSLPIHQIAQVAEHPEQVIGLHYFSPVEKMPLVEIIPHASTSEETIARVVSLAYAQGKTPIVVKDSAGFYVNRILARYINGALQCLAEGEPVEVIDQALVAFGFPVGPMTLLDEVGFDVAMKISPVLVKELGERFNSPDFLNRLTGAQRKGKKSGQGFYRYTRRGKQPDPTIYPLLNIGLSTARMTQDEIVMRCLLPMLSEAVQCLDQQVIHCPGDGDIGAIFGIGFPPFLGGPFRYIDDQGAAKIAAQMAQLSVEDLHHTSLRLKAMAESGQRFDD
ncbi:Fatty acid oxidation complex subunit alpha [Vibrio aerogenes CECT 7868]|uniref:enoyl-CoA hydratase n=1 Tax=Vibrio aerogenes CECT 7868 TaxID=1216006 RepID=A0A1M5Z8Z4_9VIBR|nr:fatty acid oxidation complex subunit alpha FadJ [Vibrio aerogenes]SHI20687.1 Fatty acid oxidation complex subunit alpha [Vibrio aerogenes CECT 7868]